MADVSIELDQSGTVHLLNVHGLIVLENCQLGGEPNLSYEILQMRQRDIRHHHILHQTAPKLAHLQTNCSRVTLVL
jgi:hypothetical protein